MRNKFVLISVVLLIVYAMFSGDEQPKTSKKSSTEYKPSTFIRDIVDWAKGDK